MDEIAEIRARTRTVWGAGDFTYFARALRPAGENLLARLAVGPGDDLLDVGCGTGDLAVGAARAGARVTGIDITPEMLTRAQALGESAGVSVLWQEGDAEDLPVGAGAFDVVTSSFGCMFAPRHRIAAAELARVMRPGGRLGVLTWPVEGTVADFFATAAPHLPPSPPAAEPPMLWGDPDHVRGIFDGTGVEIAFETARVDFAFASVEEAHAIYTTQFGPLVTARAMLEPSGRWQALSDDMAAFFAGRMVADGDRMVLRSDYLMILGRAPA